MPKTDIDLPHFIGLRISDPLKKELLEVNKQYALPAREALAQYLPVMKVMKNPMAIPRSIGKDHSKIFFSVNDDGDFQLTIDGKHIPITNDDLKVLLANVFMFTLNTAKI